MSFSLFDNSHGHLLPAFCKPYPDELLSSWLARLSFDHGLKIAVFHKLSLSKTTAHDWDVDRGISNKQIAMLAEQTNCSFEEVKHTALQHYYANRLFEPLKASQSLERWTLPRSRISRTPPKSYYNSGLLFCPSCFSKHADERYYRKNWRLITSLVCTDCGCYLMDYCPHCKKGVSYASKPIDTFYSKDVNVYVGTCEYCLKDMSDCEAEAAPDSLIEIQKELDALLENGPNDKDPESYFSVLYHFAALIAAGIIPGSVRNRMGSFIKDVFNIYGMFSGRFKGKLLVRQLPLKTRASIIRTIHWLLEEWPSRYIELCKKHGVNSAIVLTGFSNAPAWFREPIIANLTPYIHSTNKSNPEECTIMLKKNNFTRHEDNYDYDYEFCKTGSY